jgi:ArsR family transcriptional regulator, arsenate/arsenite/antimonite-responsive transcriptional repressor
MPTDSTDLPCCSAGAESSLSGDEAASLAKVFAVLGDPVRLRVLSLIASQDGVCSCDLQDPLGRSQPTISHHTKALAEAGLITGEKVGRWVWWRLVPGSLDPLQEALVGLDRRDSARVG